MTCISVQIYSVRESGDFDHQLNLVREAGFDHVETVALHGLTPAGFAAKLAAHGLAVSSMHVALATLEDEAQRAQIVDGCHRSGCSLVVMPWLPPGERPATAAGWQAVGRRLGAIGDALAGHGIRLAYHNHEWEFLVYEGRPALEWIFSATTPAQLAWEADVGWICRAGADPLAWAERLADRLVAVHAKDIAEPATAVNEDGWTTLGRGTVGWQHLLPALRARTGLFIFEHDKPVDFARTLMESCAFLRAHLGTDIEALLDALTPAEQVSLLTGADFWTTVAIPRLGIPSIKLTDGPNGARGARFKDGPKTACFPVGIALGATWNPALVEQAGKALGVETRMKGAQVLLGPTINLHRTVYNGRNFECHSEDPWLSAELTVAYVKGLQSQGVAATLKHFAGNESEYQRMTVNSQVSERALRELYLLPFERAVKEAAALCVMTGYNHLNGPWAADSDWLVRRVLRQEWGFDGLVMTDWYANHTTRGSVSAGCDLEMPGPSRERGAKLLAAMEDGSVSRDAVRDCVRRLLRLAGRLGRFGHDTAEPEQADDLPEHRALIRQLGSDATVLLKNAGALLPLSLPGGTRVALIGRGATEAQAMGGGSATVNAHHRVSPLEALRAACPGVQFEVAPGADLFRYTPVWPQPMSVDLFASEDLSGPVALTEVSPNSEVLWNDRTPPGLKWGEFSARARFEFVAEQDGLYQFSLISAGLSRMRLDGEQVIDAWSDWARGDTYFTFGCNERTHQRRLNAGARVRVEVDYTTARVEKTFYGLRVGASRVLDEGDIATAVELARNADVAIVFAGLNAEWDNEGLDRPGLELPHRQNELIERVAAVNPRITVVLQSGSPLLLPWLDRVPALLQAWYPGQECGFSIADVLLGHAEPGGRLPQTWPLRLEDTVAWGDPSAYPGMDGHVTYGEGVFIGYRHHEAHGHAVQFPFGHGLSYTTFALEQLELDRTSLQPGDQLTASVLVRNTGARAGSTVVQAYVRDLASTLPRPPQELKAFAKVALQPGQTTQVRLRFGPRALAAFDEARGCWVAEAGEFELRVGTSSVDLPLRSVVTLAAEWCEATDPQH